MKYFLKEDFDALCKEIAALCDKIKGIGQEMGLSCQEGAETFHDNFAHEDGTRQQYMWSTRLKHLIAIRNEAKVITDLNIDTEKVNLGSVVTYKEVGTDKIVSYRISSFIVFVDQANSISYDTPIARILNGSKVGDIKEGLVGRKKKEFEILNIA